jgi:pimeloyl-ACP methyl ester carboxylesterase
MTKLVKETGASKYAASPNKMPAAVVVIALSLVVGLSACAGLGRVIGFKEQAERARQMGRIDGRVDTEGPAEGTLVVAVAKPGENNQLIGVDTYVRLRPGSFAFALAPGRYQLGAYEDRNGNGLLDPDERVVRNRDSRIIDLAAGQRVTENITIMKGALIAELDEPLDILGLVERTPKDQREFSLWAWSVAGESADDLDDERFGPETGQRGLWEIMDFLNEGLSGIYFVEPYDADRIPVLFVHGISGYPREFLTMIESLDRGRFQAWFYLYPSGFRLDGISGHLAVLLERLQAKYRFDELAVVAHSMGGLVSMGAAYKYARETGRDDIRLLVSVSTPWGGGVGADKAGTAPIELPASFSDMSPSSDYLRWLFYGETAATPQPFPKDLAYHLLFGFRMSGSSSVADDGRVTLASQLQPLVQEQAITQRGYDYSHTDILHAPEVVERVNLLLDRRFR